MLRELILWVLGLLTLVIASLACGGPSEDVPPGSPAAQATATRRAAMAAVQRQIANNPEPTPLPAPTPTPKPTCSDAIWWSDARAHVGETRTIQGTIVAMRPAPGGEVLLEIGQAYPDPTGLSVIVPPGLAAESGASVCVAGRITLAEGRPVVLLNSPSSFHTVTSKP